MPRWRLIQWRWNIVTYQVISRCYQTWLSSTTVKLMTEGQRDGRLRYWQVFSMVTCGLAVSRDLTWGASSDYAEVAGGRLRSHRLTQAVGGASNKRRVIVILIDRPINWSPRLSSNCHYQRTAITEKDCKCLGYRRTVMDYWYESLTRVWILKAVVNLPR